jgi:hypothetical protein
MVSYRFDRRELILFLVGLFLVAFSSFPYRASAASATLSITPSVSNVASGATFNVNVTVTSVINLTCWEFKLYYLRGIVNCTGASEGPFLKLGGGTYFKIQELSNNFNATHGRIWVYDTILGSGRVAGSGNLVKIMFKAIGGGTTSLTLIDTNLGDEKIPSKPISHTVVNGTAVVSGVPLIHDVAITAITLGKTVVGQGYTMKINVTAQNQGDIAETFTVTLRAKNSSAWTIGTQSLTSMLAKTSATLTFTWNTTYFSFGTYNISAEASTVPGETDTSDNTLTVGTVGVSLKGDVIGAAGIPGIPDRKVDLRDVFAIGKAFGASIGDPKYNPNLDINDDGKIDLKDYFTTCKNFGKSW